MYDILAFILILLIGLLLLIKPEIAWKISHHWDTVGGEPSDRYLRYCRLVGGLAVIVCVVLVIVFLRDKLTATILYECVR